MSLRRQNLSPTAQLLRNSRLFSIPKPLPRPPVSVSYGAGSARESPTATLPFPTHQAIVTTPGSAARGDWGLKRPLPARSRLLRISNPVVKINALDTVEQITDFDSATDHVRTREKFQELGIPVLKGLGGFQDTDVTSVPPKSTFENRADVTSYDTVEGLDGVAIYLEAVKKSAIERAASPKSTQSKPFIPPPQKLQRLQNTRWRHEGPWLPGMSAEEFNNYLQNKIADRTEDFNQVLEEFVRGEIYNRRSLAAKNDENMPLDQAEAEAYHKAQKQQWSQISRSDIEAEIRAMRAQCAADPLTSNLVTKVIIPFLRLPPMKLKNVNYNENAKSVAMKQYRFSDETTPQSTHPSAGLSYLRSKSHLSNHPILGPQEAPTPVPARVIQPLQTRISFEQSARLGVAGFVVNDEFKNRGARHQSAASNADVYNIDVDTPGGKKLLVRPHYASVTPEGRVLIRITRAVGPEVAVSRGEFEDLPPMRETLSNPSSSSETDDYRAATRKSGLEELSAAMGKGGADALDDEKTRQFFKGVERLERFKGSKRV